MSSGQTMLVLVVILAEVCYLVPIYGLAAVGLQYEPTLTTWFLPVLAAAATIINLRLSRGNYRNLTIFFVNLALLVLAVFTIILPQYRGIADSIIVYILMFWVFFRSIQLVWSKKIDVYLRFDAGMAVIFFILLVVAVAELPLSEGIAWLVVAFLLNIVSISLAQSSGKADGYFPWLGAGLMTVILLPLVLFARSIFPYLFQPAEFLYELGKPVVEFLAYLLVLFLRGYFRFNANKETAAQEPVDSGFVENSPATEASPWFELIAKVFFWLLIAMIIVALFLVAAYLIRLLFNWLLKRRGRGYVSTDGLKSFLPWREMLRFLLHFWGLLKMLVLPWLPVRVGIVQAYRALMKWGFYRNCPRRGWETPFEYMNRLKSRFPHYQKELMTITTSYVEFKYGRDETGSCSSNDLKISLRKLYMPGILVWLGCSRH